MSTISQDTGVDQPVNQGGPGLAELGFKRVVLAGGGTGGHLYPALAVAKKMHALGSELVFVGTRHGLGATVVPTFGFQICFIRARGLAGSLLNKLAAVLEMGYGFVQSISILREFRPDIVIASGGYVCAPVTCAARLLNVPVVLMEQNAIAGKAIRFLSRFVDKICVSYPHSLKGLPAKKLVFTGNPVRPEIVARNRDEARRRLGIAPDQCCILVSGASQGAISLNKAVLAALPKWRDLKATVIHLTGPKNYEKVASLAKDCLEGSDFDYRAIGYQEDMAELYAASDLAVCRAGATTLAEITARGLPSVLVPYPYAAENHQEANARAMVDAGAAIMILDNAVEAELSGLVGDLITHAADLESMAKASASLGKPNAVDEVVKVAAQVYQQSRRN